MRGSAINVLSVVLPLLILGLFAGCAYTPKVEFAKANAEKTVVGVGYGWGEKAEEKARTAAINETTVLAVPRSIEFTYLRVGPYTMFKTDKVDEADLTLGDPEKLPDGGIKITATAPRSTESLRAMQFMTVAHFEVACEGDTFKARLKKCNGLMYERAMSASATRKFGTVPEKIRGNFTFFDIDRQDNGKSKMTVKAKAFVGFLGTGKLDASEKSMVLMNAWRRTCASGNGDKASPIFRQAYKANPNARQAMEYALFEMKENRLKNAIWATKAAIKINPHELDYVKVLYQLYKQTGDTASMNKIQDKLVELEAWEENPGADITTGLSYKQTIRWTSGEEESNSSGMINFREVDETELEAMSKEEK